MPERSLQEILDGIRQQNKTGGLSSSELLAPRTKEWKSSSEGTLQDVTYDVPVDAIYDRMRDGTYIPKFENYKGATGNENRLAEEQGFIEQAGRGLSKAFIKTGTYALDATVGTAVGIVNGISEGSWDAVWDNDFSNSLDDFNKKLDHKLVNYYSDEEKSNGLLAAIPGFGATNFWFNDVAGGLAFVAGAILPELAIGALTGGSTLGVSAAKMTARAGAKSLMKEGAEQSIGFGAKALKNVKKISGYNNYQKGTDVLRNQYRKVFASKTGGDIVSTATFLARTSNFEAGMEARHNFHEAIDNYYSDYEDMNGHPPSYQEISEFTKEAKSAANSVYGANMAILAVSNAVMFSNKFNIGVQAGKNITNKANSLIGLGYKSVGGKAVMQEATKGQKILGKTYMILGKPAVEGLYEEGLQGVAGTTMQNYLSSKYDPKTESGYTGWSAMYDAFAHQYGSAEGWKEMGIGMIIGSMGGVVQKGQPLIAGTDLRGKGSWKSKQAEISGEVITMNEGSDNLAKKLMNTTAVSNYHNLVNSENKKYTSTEHENAIIAQEYIKTQEKLKSESQIIEDYDTIIDNTSVEGMTDEYKTAVKEEFRRNYKDYKYAKRATIALGLDKAVEGAKKGTKLEVEDYMIKSIMLGRSSYHAAKNTADQIAALTGVDGVFNALEHFNGLTTEQKAKAQELRTKRRDLKRAKDQHMKYANDLAGIPTELNRNFTDATKQARKNKASQRAVITQKKMLELQSEVDTLEETLKNDSAASKSFDITQIDPDRFETVQGIVGAIEELDKLETYISSLEKTGKQKDADDLKVLVENYKAYSDAHREMSNGYKRMVSTNFFKSKEGKGLLKSIIGRKYEASEEFKKILRDNEEIIDKSLKLVNYKGNPKIEEQLSENEELSEREKYRLESIIRLQLGYKSVSEEIEDAEKETAEDILETTVEPSTGPLDGDTIGLRTKLNIEGKDLGNSAVLQELINKIVSEVDKFHISQIDQEALGKLEEKLSRLKEQQKEAESSTKVQLLKTLKTDLETTKEFGTEEEVKNLEKQIEDLEKETENNYDAEIKAVEEEIKVVKEDKFIKLIETEDYKRLYELNTKKAKQELTIEEQDELTELEDDIDKWIMVTGITAEGVSLSELVRQKTVLEKAVVLPTESVVQPTVEQIKDSADIPDKGYKIFYELGQTYDGVFVTKASEDLYEISGITWEKFLIQTGIVMEVEYDSKGDMKNPFLTDSEGNILITKEIVDEINRVGKVHIINTNDSPGSKYSAVLVTEELPDGGTSTTVLKTDYTDTNREDASFSDTMTPDAAYDMQEGDDIVLQISPTDRWNKDLISKYKKARNTRRKAKTKEAIEKADKAVATAIKNLQAQAVIRVLNKNGDFVAVLKAKRKSGEKDLSISNKFEQMRDQVMADEEYFESFINSSMDIDVSVEGLKVRSIYVGHLNFNYIIDENGEVVYELKSLTEEDIDNHVVDMGIMEEGKIKTHSGKGGVNTRFIDKASKSNPASKIPFIVINKGSMRVAIPVKIQSDEMAGLEEFEQMYKSSLPISEKAAQLNTFLASRGVDVNQRGNAFIGIGEGNLNDTFFNDKLAQLKSIEYFSTLEAWTDPKSDIKGTLIQGVTTIVDMRSPLHSPKVALDYSNIKVKDTPVQEEYLEEETEEENDSVVDQGLGALDDLIKKAKDKDCPK